MLDPEGINGFEVYTDANFCGNWHLPTVGDNPSSANYRTRYAIMYAGCPIIWCSKLQTQVALSMTKAEYIVLSYSLRDAIPIMQLLM